MFIAIDGYSASGKSTIGKILAEKLNYKFIDSGLIYRAITYFNIKNSLKPEEYKIPTFDFVLSVLDKDVLLSEEVSKNVSNFAKIKQIRKVSTDYLRALAYKFKDVVMVGRDIATVVLKEAELKLFFKADLHVRAKRRYLQLKEKGMKVSLNDIEKELERRDYIDSHRDISPLKLTSDYIIIDTTNKSIDDIVNYIIESYVL